MPVRSGHHAQREESLPGGPPLISGHLLGRRFQVTSCFSCSSKHACSFTVMARTQQAAYPVSCGIRILQRSPKCSEMATRHVWCTLHTLHACSSWLVKTSSVHTHSMLSRACAAQPLLLRDGGVCGCVPGVRGHLQRLQLSWLLNAAEEDEDDRGKLSLSVQRPDLLQQVVQGLPVPQMQLSYHRRLQADIWLAFAPCISPVLHTDAVAADHVTGLPGVQVQQTHVIIKGHSVYTCVRMDDFLCALAEKACALLNELQCKSA